MSTSEEKTKEVGAGSFILYVYGVVTSPVISSE